MNLTLTPAQVNALVAYLGELAARDLQRANLLDVFAALVNYSGETGIVLVCEADHSPIEAIKAIRIITNCGLREAKDMWDNLNPTRVAGMFGPIVKCATFDEASEYASNLRRSFAINNIFHVEARPQHCPISR